MIRPSAVTHGHAELPPLQTQHAGTMVEAQAPPQEYGLQGLQDYNSKMKEYETQLQTLQKLQGELLTMQGGLQGGPHDGPQGGLQGGMQGGLQGGLQGLQAAPLVLFAEHRTWPLKSSCALPQRWTSRSW